MENRFYRELSRRLAEEGISAGQPGEKGLPVLLDSRPAVFISASGLAYMPGEGGEEERELYHKAAQLSEGVVEYTQAVEQAAKPISFACIGFSGSSAHNSCALFRGGRLFPVESAR